jgi:hypothetical protein
MFKLDSEQDLLKAFRPRDRALVELSSEVKLPLFVKHCFTWAHPAGGRVFLLFAVPGGAPTGIAFDTNGGGPSVAHLCDWCRVPGLGSRVGLLTTRLNSKKVVGVHVCSDLGCRQRLEDEADRTGRSAVPATQELVARMGAFASEGLGIDLSGVRR